MSYTALYRKFRPTTFDEVKGQDAIVTTLKNQIKTGRIGHAYLFTGTRGTGKTTVAKIFARAVNCENPQDASPCNECQTCKNVLSGSSMNVIEIDAASNNGVENIRQIRDEVQYSPTEGRYKVYIIDEVHMLSIGAFNALLKTLEEPPEYVIFILATTEVHKIPITILSRCQRYDFRRITIDTIEARLQELIGIEGADVEPKAVRYIAKAADGSMRDALSLLDQCLAFYLGKHLTYENVLEVLGAVDTEVFEKLLESILKQDGESCIHLVEEIVMQGRELGQFVLDFTWFLRNMLLIKSSEGNLEAIEDFIDASKERVEEMQRISADIDADTLMRFIRILSDLSNQMKYSSLKRVLLEVALLKMTRPETENDMESVLQRLSNLEKKMENGVVLPEAKQYNIKVQEEQQIPENKPKEPVKPVPEDIQDLIQNWHQLEGRMGNQIRIAYRRAKLYVQDDTTLVAAFTDPTLADIVTSEGRVEKMNEWIQELTGKKIIFKVELLNEDSRIDTRYENIENRIHMQIEEEED